VIVSLFSRCRRRVTVSKLSTYWTKLQEAYEKFVKELPDIIVFGESKSDPNSLGEFIQISVNDPI
jgi:hypothetical protein